jgi:EmrB/QacA subfamily drug resistance transporter
MTAFMGSALNIALPIIGIDFSASALMLSWLSTIYLLTSAALLLPIGKLSDIYGRTRFFKIGLILFTTGSFMCAFSPDATTLFLIRIIQGTGAAFIFTSSTALIVSSFPQSQRGRALGINIAAVYTGLSSGPFLGGIITHYWSWRWIFFVNSAIGFVLIVISFFYLKYELEDLRKEKFDYAGSIIYILSIILLMIGISLLPDVKGYLVLFVGLTMLVFFYFFESKLSTPVFDVMMFRRNKTFTFSNLAALINYSATFAIGFLLSFYLQSVKGLNPQDAGIILITQPIVQAIFSPLAGKLSDKIEPQIVASIGMSLLTIGLIFLCFLSPGMSIVLIIVNLALLGLGFALFSSPNVNAVMSSVEKKYYGVASSILASMRLIGQMLSMGLVIIIFTIYIGGERITQDNQVAFLESTRVAFIIFSLFSFAGIFASLSRGNIHSN